MRFAFLTEKLLYVVNECLPIPKYKPLMGVGIYGRECNILTVLGASSTVFQAEICAIK